MTLYDSLAKSVLSVCVLCFFVGSSMLIGFSLGFVQVSHLFFVELCLNMAVLANTVLGVSAALLKSVTDYVLLF